MAVPANTVQRVSRVGVREDLSNVISILAREDFPLMSNFGKGTTKAFDFDWQNDSLAAVDTNNAVIDGDDVTNDAYPATVRLKNYVQLMDKTVGLSSGVQQVNHAGQHTSMAAAMNKKARELKRDMETAAGCPSCGWYGAQNIGRCCDGAHKRIARCRRCGCNAFSRCCGWLH